MTVTRLAKKDEVRKMLEKVEDDNVYIDELVKGYDFIIYNDKLIKICDKTPTIKSTIYYDDEYKAPSINIYNFMKYNLKFNKQNKYKEEVFAFGEHMNLYIYYGINCYHVGYMFGTESGFKEADKIEVTDELLKEINKVVVKANKRYCKRLRNYYKRYNNKISTYGYWANR